jgi:hypothetical protein
MSDEHSDVLSFKHNALLGVTQRLNLVNAGNGVTIATNDATRATLGDTSSRLTRRANDVVIFVAWFPKSLVTFAEAVASAETITPTTPLVISYTKSSGGGGGGGGHVVVEATATSASATSGTTAPTVALGGGGGGDGGSSSSGISSSTVKAIWITALVVVVLAVIVFLFVRDERRLKRQRGQSRDYTSRRTSSQVRSH